MIPSHRPLRSWLSAAMILLVASLATAFATPLVVSDATFSGSYTNDSSVPPVENITGEATLTGITTSEGTFTQLVGASVGGTISSTREMMWISSLSQPANENVAVTGLTMHDGTLNIGTVNFQFGSILNSDTRIFLFDIGGNATAIGESATISLIDASNNAVGTYTLALTAATFGSTPLASFLTLRETNTTTPTSFVTGAITFSLADFTGTGSLANVTGIKMVTSTSSSGLDPFIVGITAVPEPSAAVLLTLTGMFFCFRRPGRQAASEK